MAKRTRAPKVNAGDIAMKLLEKRQEINLLKKDEKDLTDTLKTLIRNGEKQDIYQLRPDNQLAISDAEKAYSFALEHNLLKVDISSVDKFLKSQRAAVPPGFGIKVVEKLVEISDKEIAKENFIIEG